MRWFRRLPIAYSVYGKSSCLATEVKFKGKGSTAKMCLCFLIVGTLILIYIYAVYRIESIVCLYVASGLKTMKTLETISMSHPAKAWTELIPVCPFSVKPRVFVVLISLSLRFDRKHLFLFLLCLPVSKQGTPTKTSQINTISVDGDDRPWSVVSSYAVVAVHEEHMRNTSRWLFPAV